VVDRVSVVTDLGYGDSGKGAFVDYLCANEGATLVIRNNGGAQAGHNVVTPDGRRHCFSQFGAGTFTGATTYLGPNMLVSPMHLLRESKKLDALGIPYPLTRLCISSSCRVITPYHELTNQVRETVRGEERHGSCGFGIGELMQDQFDGHPFLTMADLRVLGGVLYHEGKIRTVLHDIWERKSQIIYKLSGQTLENFDDEIIEFYKFFIPQLHVDWKFDPDLVSLLHDSQHVVFEGAQGVMIDETYGFHPHTTWSDTTPRSAWKIIEQFPGIFQHADIHNYGLFRAYSTRHGAGPFPSYSPFLTEDLNDPHNPTNQWQGNFRCGPFDLVAAKYALNVCKHVGYPIDSLVFSCLDQLTKDNDLYHRAMHSYKPINGEYVTWTNTNRFIYPDEDLKIRSESTSLLSGHYSDGTNTLTFYDLASSFNFVKVLAQLLGSYVSYTSQGPTRDDRKKHYPAG